MSGPAHMNWDMSVEMPGNTSKHCTRGVRYYYSEFPARFLLLTTIFRAGEDQIRESVSTVELSNPPCTYQDWERLQDHLIQCPHFTDRETEVQKGKVTCPRWHAWLGAEVGPKLPNQRSPDSQTYNLYRISPGRDWSPESKDSNGGRYSLGAGIH